METVEPTLQMWATLGLIAAAIVLYAMERVPLELTSLFLLSTLLLLFHFFPLEGPQGENLLPPQQLFQGFANPALIAVLALMVLGHGVARTGALEWAVRVMLRWTKESRHAPLALAFGAVFALSPFLNNTPIVVMFIPIMQTIVQRLQMSPSTVMMPLSFVSILGGMLTLIGTSTNLLVSGVLLQMHYPPLGFFDFTIPGIVLAAVGVLYLTLVAPRLLRDRASLTERFTAGPHRRFVAQLAIAATSELVGEPARFNLLDIKGCRLALVQRGEHAFPPPYENVILEPGDVLVLLATRDALVEVSARYPGLLHAPASDKPPKDETQANERRRDGEQVLAEVVIPPASRLVGRTLEDAAFRAHYKCLVLGLQRRARMIRRRMTEIRLRPGDVLVIEGAEENVRRLQGTRDLVPIGGSIVEIPASHLARRAALIFLAVVGLAATQMLPIAIVAVCGVALMIGGGVLSVHQAAAAIDRQVILLVGASLALGGALQETGGAVFVAQQLLTALGGASPAVVLSALFLLVAIATNVLSNNATAVLFTPIAVGVAVGLGADPFVFALAVLFSANCSFATPIGYQTNLLVMGPGHYRFRDFLRVGAPLAVLLWLTFSLFAPWYYGL